MDHNVIYISIILPLLFFLLLISTFSLTVIKLVADKWLADRIYCLFVLMIIIVFEFPQPSTSQGGKKVIKFYFS